MAAASAQSSTGERKSTLALFLRIVPTLHVALTVALTVTFVATAYFTSFFSFDSGWEVLSSEVTTARKVVIDQDLEVTRDFKISGEGSVLEMTGVDCAAEETAAQGSGRLCMDSADATFKASVDGGPYASLVGERGLPGQAGRDGTDGKNGLSCWDLDGDGLQDRSEDVNGDGRFSAADCRPLVLAGRATVTRGNDDVGPVDATIVLPEAFRDAWKSAVTQRSGRLNVQLTAEGEPRSLYFVIDEKEPRVRVIDGSSKGGPFHYLIQVVD